MALKRLDPPWDYLRRASTASLQSFELSRLNHAANLRHEIATLLDQWLEETAQAMLARWLLENRDILRDPHDVERDVAIPLPETVLGGALPKFARELRTKSRASEGGA
ncbi:MAG: hypothetical protein ABSA32_08905 [Candidatus Acidiferrales bacterium]|jgi:hypothetical protein